MGSTKLGHGAGADREVLELVCAMEDLETH